MDALSVLIYLAFFLIPIAIYLWTGVLVYRDAKRRGKPPMLVSVLALLLVWPISLLVWIALRPDEKRPPFNLDDHRVQ